MKRPVALLVLMLAFVMSAARAQADSDDQYLIIYGQMQQADALAEAGQARPALAEYAEVQAQLQQFQKINPDWNPRIINFRQKYLAEKISDLTAQLPAATNVVPVAANAAGAVPVVPDPSAGLRAQLESLQGQMQNVQADNTRLAAKLREALLAQPAAVDPRELAAAREQIRSLMKENDLLKAVGAASHAAVPSGDATADAQTVAALKQARAALADATQKLAAATARASQLAAQNLTLQTRLQILMATPDATQALREENALLKKQLAALKTAPAIPPAPAPAPVAVAVAVAVSVPDPEIARLRLQVAALKSDLTVRTLETLALENRVQQLQVAAVTAPATPPAAPPLPDQKENEDRIRALELERDGLLAKLGAANEPLYGRNKPSVARMDARMDALMDARMDALMDQLNTLRARIAVDEAPVVPYSAEELALFRQPVPALANPDAPQKSVPEPPAGVTELVARAQTHFAAHQYDAAEADYQNILQRDENNGLALANLAIIELQQHKLADAEKHARAALKQSPNAAFNLATLGKILFAQGQYDAALDTLGRAAKLDPQNPELQNYLGATLAQKGLRTQAETAFRTALQLDPDYAPAHNNLAAIYLSQQPPLVQLARWHYQKALDAGQPRNAGMEKLLAEKGAAVAP